MIEMDIGFGDDAAVIRPEGRLTMVTAPELRSVVLKAVEDKRVRVVVDLSATEFMDSSGLGALISGLKTTRQAGGDLRVACLSPQVSTIMQLANLDRVLQPYSTVADALK